MPPEPSELCRPARKPVVHAPKVVANKPVVVANMVANRLDMVANTDSVVANSVPVVANRSSDRHKDLDSRRLYQRDLMRKRRAAKKP